jgi:hypothetical protein
MIFGPNTHVVRTGYADALIVSSVQTATKSASWLGAQSFSPIRNGSVPQTLMAASSWTYEREDFIFDPLHYLALIEQKINALAALSRDR